jgi:hypothetical protein
MDPTQRQIARLLGYPATATLTNSDLQSGVLANPDRVSHGLVEEAFASDDVSSAADARAFVEERIAEWETVLDGALRNRLASLASVEIQRRAPSP